MYYLQSRYYDAGVGRFVNSDIDETTATVQGVLASNQFCYCECNPINNVDANGGISLGTVKSIFNGLLKYVKKIVGWLQVYVDYKLKLYTSISPGDISAIAKSIKRSPHRVRQALESLTSRWKNAKSKLAKIAKAITLIALIATVSQQLIAGVSFFDVIATQIVEGLVETVKWFVSEGLSKLLSLVPALGGLIGFFLGKLIGVVLDQIFTSNFVKSLTKKFTKHIKTKTHKEPDYFASFIKCWA